MIDTRTQFSLDRVYRYTLWRCWGDVDAGAPYMAVIGLNPSTADEQNDDPTIRRCISFAKREGMGALCMLNLFAFRATDPKVMKAAETPIGELNNAFIYARCKTAKIVLAAWGTHGIFQNRASSVMEILAREDTKISCLGRTAEGYPRHPLYVRADKPFEPFTP